MYRIRLPGRQEKLMVALAAKIMMAIMIIIKCRLIIKAWALFLKAYSIQNSK